MNLYYEVKDNSVIVTNENGCKREEMNTDKISEILVNENKIEIIDKTINEYNEEKLKNKLYIDKICKKISILTTSFINLYTIFLVIGNASFKFIFDFTEFIKFLSPIILIPCLGFSCLYFIPKKKEQQNIQINDLIKILNIEKEKIENYLISLKNQVKEKDNLDKNENKIISLEEINFDYMCEFINKTMTIENEIEEKNKIKTLKLIKQK